MIDREKVVGHLNDCMEASRWDNTWVFVRKDIIVDALSLLKEQEAVEPTLIREGRNKYYNDYACPHCDNEVVYEQNYCSECGAQFRWEGR